MSTPFHFESARTPVRLSRWRTLTITAALALLIAASASAQWTNPNDPANQDQQTRVDPSAGCGMAKSLCQAGCLKTFNDCSADQGTSGCRSAFRSCKAGCTAARKDCTEQR